MKMTRKMLYAVALLGVLSLTSCRDTNPDNPGPDMGVTSDSIGNTDGRNNNYDTSGADTGMDGE